MGNDGPPAPWLTAPSHPIQEKLSLNLDHKSRIFQNLNGALGEEKGNRRGLPHPEICWTHTLCQGSGSGLYFCNFV